MSTHRLGSRWVVWVSIIGTGLIAAGAFWLSFTSLSDLAARAGVQTPWVWPLIVDGLIVVATIAAMAMARRPGAWYPWLLLTGGAILSVIANALHAMFTDSLGVPPVMAAIVASVPPVVLVSVTHLTVLLARTEPNDTRLPFLPDPALNDEAGTEHTTARMAYENASPVSIQAEAGVFIIDYLMAHGGLAPAGEVTAAAQARGLSLDAVKHARARARHPRIRSQRGSHGWMWSVERTEGAQHA